MPIYISATGTAINPLISWQRKLHYFLTSVAIRLGPSNPVLRALLKRKCRLYGCDLRIHQHSVEVRKDRRVMVLPSQQFVYATTLAERFDTYFSSLLPAYKGDTFILDFSKPQVQTYRDSGLQFELSSFPEESDILAAYFRWYLPRPGDLIFDIGAHCGVSTCHFARQVGPTGRVIAFEPDPKTFALLLRNIERHKLWNVIPVQAALSSKRGRSTFFSEGTLGSCLATVSTRDTTGTRETVETMTLSDAFDRWGVPQFCKIDIEGSEIEVVESSIDLIAGVPTHFVIDTNHIVDGVQTRGAVEKALQRCGLDVESLDVGGMTTWAAKRNALLELTPESAELALA